MREDTMTEPMSKTTSKRPATPKIVLHESGPPEGAVYGTQPFLLRSNTYCGKCQGYHDMELCPDCGADVYIGFGLGIAPGFGEWKVCERYCGWFWKHALLHDEC